MIDSARVSGRRRLLLQSATAIALVQLHGLAQAATKIVVGQSLPLTGALATYGSAKLSGSRTYFAHVNQGNSDRRIEILALDDQYDPSRTIENTQALTDKHQATALLGYFGVPTINAVLPLLDQLKIPVVGLTSGSNAIRAQRRPYVFPVRASYAVEIKKIISHMKTIGLERVSLIVQKNAFGEEVRNTFIEQANAEGVKKIGFLDLATDLSNVSALVNSISSDTQSIFLATLSGPAVACIKVIKAKKLPMQLYGLSALDANSLYQSLGLDATGVIQSQVMPSPNDTTKAVSRSYTAALKKYAPEEAPSYFGLEGYIEAMILHEGIKRAGNSIMGANGRAALQASLEQMNNFDLGGFQTSYSPSLHTGSLYVDLTILGNTGRTLR